MLEVVDLKKSFGGREILHGLNLTFESGVYGLLGPNGAGKSTLMNIITGLLRQTSGQVLFHGVPASDRRSGFAAKLGYLPQQPGYYKNYTAAEFLRYLSALKGIRGKNEAQIAHLLEFVNLSENADQKLGTFSGGMLRRAGLAQALLGKPEVVILDEPTAGLDPLERIRLRNLLAEIAKGRTVIVALPACRPAIVTSPSVWSWLTSAACSASREALASGESATCASYPSVSRISSGSALSD